MELTTGEFRQLHALHSGLRRFHRWGAAEVASVGLTPAHHELLLAVRALGGEPGPSVGAVASELVLSHHSAVELANRAEAAGHVARSRDPDDGRVVRLRLEPLGEEVLAALAPHHRFELDQLRALLAPPA